MGEPSTQQEKKPLINSRNDPVKNFEKWKKKYTKKKEKCKIQRKQSKKPEWQTEKESISRLVQRYSEISASEINRFSDFPLSKKTIRGLVEAQYRLPTEIQKQTIGLALQGKDVLGAAKTGSGKTLAFLIPALECLYRQQWSADDGLGILIISPTRELAYQTFEVLRKVGRSHEFSAGLIIGGKDLKQESSRIHRTNILICTPGRLLQHMDETSFFHTSNMQMLVLDEADRILDMGFADTMNAIVENLPKKRQTLLFSATQTKSVKDLARLSLKDPEYVWVHEKAKFSTPATLEQNYVVCDLRQKINLLFSFVRNHLKKKSIVFFSSCKQVQYLFRVFCRLRPGIPILALHGKQQQMKRMEVYNDFVRKKAAVLFATDIAARGLDFPAVSWVLQLDCPEDANTYIHRVGRTARYKEGGEALLVLLPSEVKGMARQLEEKKVPINEIKINPEKLLDVQGRLEAFLAQEQEMKERAQRCFVSYLRAVYLMKNKEVFDVSKLPLAEYARSMGLAVAPRVRFLQKAQSSQPSLSGPGQKPAESGTVSDDEIESFKAKLGGRTTTEIDKERSDLSSEEDDSGDEEASERLKAKDQTTFQLTNEEDDDDDDCRDVEIFTVKRRDVFGVNEGETAPEEEMTKSRLRKTEKLTKVKDAKKALKKQFKVNTKIVFADDGVAVQQWPQVQKTVVKDVENEEDLDNGINLEKARQRLTEEDKFDKEAYRQKIKEKHRERRLKEKAARRAASKKDEKAEEDEGVAYLDQDSDNEVDLSALPDPDKYRGLEEEDQPMEESSSDHEDVSPRKRTLSSRPKEKEEKTVAVKKKKTTRRSVESFEPLNTGLSLVEDEELVLHLLNSSS
ncbi:PREDICTED: probable ATP-dependent RNA helicase DDX10 [Nanorana parkeri]|uniref:probable ATP-dependent RNA helicase DDX10 n=1 Tax=Nanorana parkeri TaxID=125878 RepID=UPI0008543B27|nr:PREDICTED: probable ATP-dependent RNA helicase DDX10 [Nanorana parkeri]